MSRVVIAGHTYIEYRQNNVVIETTVLDDEIRYSVTRNGTLLFNEALEGHYSFRKALALARRQEDAARLAGG